MAGWKAATKREQNQTRLNSVEREQARPKVNPNQRFSMPMFNPWVPEKVRPWIYLLFALFFQLSSGVYFGSLQQMVGATGFTREDMVMVAMFGRFWRVAVAAALHH